MKIFKFSIIFIFLFLSKVYAVPTLPDPGTRSTTTFTPINYDYGPRNVTSGTNPHIGIDYDIRTGNKAYTVESGAVLNISNLGTRLAQIKIGNWNYIHIEDNSVIIQGYSPNSKNPRYLKGIPADIIVFREIVNGSTETIKALSTQEFPDGEFYDPITKSSVPVHTFVAQKEWIFVPKNIAAPHLHLDYNKGSRNPLRYVTHKDTQNPLITPKYKYIDTNNLAQNFSDNIIYNTGAKPLILQLGANVRSDKDLNTAEIFVRSESTSIYTSMNKWTYEPVTQGIVNTTTGKGETIYRKDTESKIELAIEEGVYPFLDRVSFDFFKYRWDTLKSASGLAKALINSDAVWQDGPYLIKMEATDITEHTTTKEERKMLDNFRPYVQKVQIKNKDTQGTFYKAEWFLSDSTLNLTKGTNQSLQFNSTYTISIIFSEGMSRAGNSSNRSHVTCYM